jgi:hypothetical protein
MSDGSNRMLLQITVLAYPLSMGALATDGEGRGEDGSAATSTDWSSSFTDVRAHDAQARAHMSVCAQPDN